ncbi:kinase-like domain-containing protein [Mycena floridula]|nr:kinase-like domain-containing protein [Mycena floridula]
MVLSQELDFTRQIRSPSWACALTELLQNEIRYSIDDAAYRALCLRNLRRIIKKFDILPPSFVIHDIVLDEPRRPLFGGGFADVYKGSRKGQHVCLKVLRLFTQTIEMREKLLKDFCREALLWKQLDHPNVLPLLGVTIELFAPSFCLVSPWMSNGNVMQYLEQNPEFSRINAVRDIAAAIQYLHEHKPLIVHADIRGTNVLVLDNLQCCLADFGLSAITESSGITGTSTATRAGSVRWMAPEILSLSTHGAELNQTPRDIYAFACTVLEIYTGKHPFPEYRVDFKVGHEVSEGRRPSRPPNVFSNKLWDLVEKCWRQDPAQRPPAREVVSFLGADSTFQPQTMSLSHIPNGSQISLPFAVPGNGAGQDIHSSMKDLVQNSQDLRSLGLHSHISDLTTQYSLPTLFAPPPQLTPKPPPVVSDLPDFQTLKSNYLSMLSQPSSDDTIAANGTFPLSSAEVFSSMEKKLNDPHLDDVPSFSLNDPSEDFLATPVIQDLDWASIQSYNASLPLFGGSRKSTASESLVPVDAPTQPWKYVLPSATSRKEIPAVIFKRHSRSAVFGDEEDELDEPLTANATEKEQIEWKRRQNTLAARKSRKRKLEYQQQLEDQVQNLLAEVQKYKAQAETTGSIP